MQQNEFPKKKIRQRICELLADGVRRSPKMVAAELGIPANTAYKTISRMKKEGVVEEVQSGYFRLASSRGAVPEPCPAAAPEPKQYVQAGYASQGSLSSKLFRPSLEGIGSRTRMEDRRSSRPPFHDAPSSQVFRAADAVGPASAESYRVQAELESDLFYAYWGWAGPLEPEYDLLEPYTLIDTEAYLARAIDRKISLMFRNGTSVVGSNKVITDYLNKRISQIEYVQRQSWDSFLKEILFNLHVCSNCIVLKIRNGDASGGVPNPKNRHRVPVAGYKIVPPQTIFPWLDGQGRIEKWRRFFGSHRPFRDYPPEDVIHFYWDRKPGHFFGTPRTIAVRDDILALRRIEENLELMMLRNLFPLYHFKVGTEKAPCQITPEGISEIELVKGILQNMPKDGMFVTDERVHGEILESRVRGLDISPILDHYKRRVVTGMGVSSIDLGEPDTANRATADNVSQNLKDAISSDCAWFAAQLEQFIFRELIEESPYNWNVQRALASIQLEFHEIDVDTMIKKELHAINAYNNNAITHAEMRQRMKLPPLAPADEKDTHFMQHVLPLATLKATKGLADPDRSVSTALQPENQHGKNLGPTRAKSSLSGSESLLADLLDVREMMPEMAWEQVVDLWLTSHGLDSGSAGQIRDALLDTGGDLEKLQILCLSLGETSSLSNTNQVAIEDVSGTL